LIEEYSKRIARHIAAVISGIRAAISGGNENLADRRLPVRIIEQVLEGADQGLLEGRESVRDLRQDGVTGDYMSTSLVRCGEELEEDHITTFRLSVIGTPRPLDPTVCNEAYRIGREAIANAFQHSHAVRIEAEIVYDDTDLRRVVRDDGCGIAQEILDRGRAGHWGLSSIRERADNIGAKLKIWSLPGAGAEVSWRSRATLLIPEASMSRSGTGFNLPFWGADLIKGFRKHRESCRKSILLSRIGLRAGPSYMNGNPRFSDLEQRY
jgi:signal transduction histidine kinase